MCRQVLLRAQEIQQPIKTASYYRNTSQMIPFFVVDRPISLEIIKGLKIPKGKKIGLMAHANTSENFRKAFRKYPRKHVIKMCDSAIFHIARSHNTYAKLFQKYEQMDADYGVMIDVFGNSDATIASARRGLAAYKAQPRTFKLVGVAQGTTVSEYLNCYKRLSDIGYAEIAVGGLLQRRERSARYMKVENEPLLKDVLKRIKQEFDPSWLFVLGCLHPSRLQLFREISAWGDYKGWIFEYKTRDETLEGFSNKLMTNHLPHVTSVFKSSRSGVQLNEALARRERAVDKRKRVHRSLIDAKRELRDFITVLRRDLFAADSKKGVELLLGLKSRALLHKSEQLEIMRVAKSAGISANRSRRIIDLSKKTRSLKDKLMIVEAGLRQRNEELLSALWESQKRKSANSDLRSLTHQMIKILSLTEQDHRIRQVRGYVEQMILKEI